MLIRFRGGEMRFTRIIILLSGLLLLAALSYAQDPNVKHFEKDGLSFDYPANWQIEDHSTGQMQFLELAQGDVIVRVRSPREWLKTPEKETHAKKLFQEQYVSDFATQLEQHGLNPKKSPITTKIAGGDAEGLSLRAMWGGQPGGMDSFARVISDRLVNLSIIASEKDIAKAGPAWDLIRNSIKVEPAPQAKPSPAKKP
jgi:hypothetical protein